MRLLFLLFTAIVCFADDPPSGPLRERIDLNNAPQETIEKLPGVGPKLAKEIMARRPFKTIDELDNVKGIGPKKLEKIRPHVFIVPMRGIPASRAPTGLPNSATNQVERININTATDKELEKLPGIGAKRADEIIQHRPYSRPEDLMKIRGLKQAQFDKLKDLVKVN